MSQISKDVVKVKEGLISYYKTRECNSGLHRVDGPAYITLSGCEAWFQNNRFHRLDGPALIYSGGNVEFYIEGRQYSWNEFLEYVERLG